MKYRKADAYDAPCLADFRKRLLLEEGERPTADIDGELSKYFQDSLRNGSFVAWLAQEESDIVASGGVCFYQLLPAYANPTGRVAYVTNMYTLPTYRRKGIASHLLELVIAEARERGYATVRLHASADGRPIYKRAGFVDAEGYMMMRLT